MSMKRFLSAWVGSATILLGLTVAVSAKTIDVVASFTVLADVVKNVGGDHVRVKSLVPPNGDPHDFEPSPDDARAVKAAAVTFISGEGLETWFERLAKASGSTVKPVVVSKGIETRTMEEDGKTITDPHVWNSVPNVLIWVSNIEAALKTVDPADAASFSRQAQNYRERLDQLDAFVRRQIDSVAQGKRTILTSHDAFNYYGQTYGVTFIAPLGVSTETEASAGDVAKLIDQIRKEDVSTYFIENSTDPRLVNQIAAATGANLGGELYPEALSPAGGPVPSYVELMKYNTMQIVKALRKN